jgi:diketogulonate reductase-like aldo/keto reductase
VEHNFALVQVLRQVAEAKGRTVAQLAIAWVAAQGQDIVPLAGARTRERLAEALPALEPTLTVADLAEIEKAVPPGAVRGDRYPSAFMARPRRGELSPALPAGRSTLSGAWRKCEQQR